MDNPTPTPAAEDPGLSPPGVNDIHFSDATVLGARTITCNTCPQHPYYADARAFNAHLDAVHLRPRRLICDQQFFACGRRQMGLGPERKRRR